MNMSPTLMVGGGLGLLAAGALATAVVLKWPASSPSTPPAETKTAAAQTTPGKAAAPSTAPKAGSGTPQRGSAESPPLATRPAVERADKPVCANCGVVESVATVTRKGEGTGLGAVAGGVIGGVVGNQMGGGSGRDAMTVIGAVGGGIAGHEVEKRARATTEYQIKVRMADGTLRTVTQARSLPVGQPVEVNGNQLTAVDPPATSRDAQPRVQQTGARS